MIKKITLISTLLRCVISTMAGTLFGYREIVVKKQLSTRVKKPHNTPVTLRAHKDQIIYEMSMTGDNNSCSF